MLSNTNHDSRVRENSEVVIKNYPDICKWASVHSYELPEGTSEIEFIGWIPVIERNY